MVRQPAALAAAINAAGLSVSAVAALGVVTLTCKWSGDSGNDISLQLNRLGRNNGESTPAGLVVVLTAMASGAGAPEVAQVLAARDRDAAKILPAMARLLPASLLEAAAEAIELAVLSHAFDLRMAQVLESLAPKRKRLDDALYGEAYRASGLPRLRSHQIDLIARVGKDLGRGLKLPGVGMLLKLSRGPATAAGLAELQRFLERGVDAFARLGDPAAFVAEIEQDERELSRRLFAGDPQTSG